MYELTLAHLTTIEHERDLEADLRRRQILKASDLARRPVTAPTTGPVRLPASHSLPTTGRVRTVGR